VTGWSDGVRWAAGWAVIVLAVLSRGDVLVLAALLALVSWRPSSAVALVAALLATGWRWGSTALEAVSGAQAVLGPAGWVGSGRVAASSWLAALAIVAAAPRRSPSDPEVGGMAARSTTLGAPNLRWWRSAPDVEGTRARVARLGAPNLVWALGFGSAAAVVVAGSALGGSVWWRVLATVAAAAVTLAVAEARQGGRLERLLDVVAVGAGVVALVLVSSDAPPWAGTLDTGALVAGSAAALAVAALVTVGASAASLVWQRRS
jgi:hypothetical protein